MIFGVLNPKKIRHENLTDLSISPVRCSHYTLGDSKKSFSTVLFMHTSDYLCYLRRKQTVIQFLTPPENVTTLTCELKNFFLSNWRFVAFFQTLEAEKNQLWVVVGGSENNRLWTVTTGLSGKQCHRKYSEWPPSTLVHDSSLFRHWSVA